MFTCYVMSKQFYPLLILYIRIIWLLFLYARYIYIISQPFKFSLRITIPVLIPISENHYLYPYLNLAWIKVIIEGIYHGVTHPNGNFV